MALLERLRAASASIDPQFLPTSQEAPGVLGGIALYLEYGDRYLDAAESDNSMVAVQELITGADVDEPVDPEESDRQAAAASRRATSQQTQVEHEPGEKPRKGKS